MQAESLSRGPNGVRHQKDSLLLHNSPRPSPYSRTAFARFWE